MKIKIDTVLFTTGTIEKKKKKTKFPPIVFCISKLTHCKVHKTLDFILIFFFFHCKEYFFTCIVAYCLMTALEGSVLLKLK